jgi:DnaJ-class molecular chaperone
MSGSMKRIEEQTYYEILEVSPNATAIEIQKGYEHAKATFQSDSLAVYSLFSEEEARKVQAMIEEAYRVLMDDALRRQYDESHSQAIASQKWESPPAGEGGAREKKAASLIFTDLSVDTREGGYRGRGLRAIREEMGIDLKAVSQETKISTRVLEWIEDEVGEKLPAQVYLKGFLRSYAQCLGLEPQKVIEDYLKFLGPPKKK